MVADYAMNQTPNRNDPFLDRTEITITVIVACLLLGNFAYTKLLDQRFREKAIGDCGVLLNQISSSPPEILDSWWKNDALVFAMTFDLGETRQEKWCVARLSESKDSMTTAIVSDFEKDVWSE